IEYAQEARSYALLMLLATIITVACIGIVARLPTEQRNLRSFAILTIAGILAGYTHYFGALFAVVAGLVALAATRSRRAVLCVAIIAASPLPWILYHTRHMSAGAELAGWMADFP